MTTMGTSDRSRLAPMAFAGAMPLGAPAATPPDRCLRQHPGILLALFAATYLVLARGSLAFVLPLTGLASIWPLSGLALAVLVLRPEREWPACAAVVFAMNALANLAGGNPWPLSLAFAGANTLEPLLAAWIMTRWTGRPVVFTRLRHVLALAAVAVVLVALTALVGAAVPALALGADYADAWVAWWVADGLGILLLTPFIVTWAAPGNSLQGTPGRRHAEALALVALLMAEAWFIFGVPTAPGSLIQK